LNLGIRLPKNKKAIRQMIDSETFETQSGPNPQLLSGCSDLESPVSASWGGGPPAQPLDSEERASGHKLRASGRLFRKLLRILIKLLLAVERTEVKGLALIAGARRRFLGIHKYSANRIFLHGFPLSGSFVRETTFLPCIQHARKPRLADRLSCPPSDKLPASHL
jgi:hypothetical protein